MDLHFERIDYSDAADFYDKYEHLGDPGRGVYHWGAFRDQTLVSAVSFGSTCFAIHENMFADLSDKHGVNVYQLTRGGTNPSAPKNTGSWTVSRGLKQLKYLRGGSLVVAYSDPKYNEIGTIYQAANFLYLGKTQPKGQSNYIIDGEWMSGWTVRNTYGTRSMRKLRSLGLEVQRIPLRPKYRYVYPAASQSTKRNLVADLKDMVSPYPKREEEGVSQMNISELVRKRKIAS
jgi:hypothetical protein